MKLLNALELVAVPLKNLLITKSNTSGNLNASNDAVLSIRGDSTNAAAISFHRSNTYAVNIGLDLDNSFKIGAWSDGANIWRIISDSSGNFTARGNVTAYSDLRLKSNVKTIDGALEKVKKLRGVEFDKAGRHEIGVIAQEVQHIIPEVVLEGTDDMKILSVAYGNLVGLLIEAIKEQQTQIDELKALVGK